MATKKLQASGVTSARLDAELLLSHALDTNRTWLHAHGDEVLQGDSLHIANGLLERRLAREPIAYITGHKEFYGRDFIVTPDVLIPRPESEVMIDLLEKLFLDTHNYRNNRSKGQTLKGAALVDIGAGSGCLGITAKLEFPELAVTLSEVSPAALAIARDNASRLHAAVSYEESDLLSKFEIRNSKFDIILANLPYVDTSWERSPETDHEPALALFAGDHGLALIKRCIAQASRVLQPGGYLLCEADPEQHHAIITHAKKTSLIHAISQDYIVVLQK